jgi:hypothetical protein
MVHASHGGAFDWQQIRRLFRVVAGTPITVANAIERWAEDAGTNRIILQIHRGDMPHWKVVRTLTSLAEQVIPLLKERQKAAGRGQKLAAAE